MLDAYVFTSFKRSSVEEKMVSPTSFKVKCVLTILTFWSGVIFKTSFFLEILCFSLGPAAFVYFGKTGLPPFPKHFEGPSVITERKMLNYRGENCCPITTLTVWLFGSRWYYQRILWFIFKCENPVKWSAKYLSYAVVYHGFR